MTLQHLESLQELERGLVNVVSAQTLTWAQMVTGWTRIVLKRKSLLFKYHWHVFTHLRTFPNLEMNFFCCSGDTSSAQIYLVLPDLLKLNHLVQFQFLRDLNLLLKCRYKTSHRVVAIGTISSCLLWMALWQISTRPLCWDAAILQTFSLVQ